MAATGNVITERFNGAGDGVGITTSNSSISAVANGTPSFETGDGPPLQGSACLKTIMTALTAVRWDYTHTSGGLYFTTYVYVSADTTATSSTILSHQNTGTIRAQVRINSSGQFDLRNGTTNVWTSTAVTAGQWVRLRWRTTWGGTPSQSVELFYGSNLHGTTPDQSSGSQTLTDATHNRLVVGMIASASATSGSYLLWDHLDMDDTAFVDPAVTSVDLVPADSAHGLTSESPALTQVHSLAPADSAHAHATEAPTLTQVHVVTPADSAHGHTSESPALAQVHVVTPADSAHGHTADSPALTQVHSLAPADSAHGHTADSPALTQAHQLAPADSTHSHIAESPALTQAYQLAPVDTAHGHSTESPALTQVHVLAPADSLHTHSTESPLVDVNTSITPVDTAHGHSSESPTLTQVHVLAPADSRHTHATEQPTLAQVHVLAPLGSRHTLTADSPVLTREYGPSTRRGRAVPRRARASTVPDQPRTSTVPDDSRTVIA